MFEEGEEVYVKATIARSDSTQSFIGFENVKGDGVHFGPYSFIVANTELIKLSKPTCRTCLHTPVPTIGDQCVPCTNSR